ncbi:MAG: hypothetical protein ACU843_03460 [Gammaproteobacteria bacterium]
MAKDKCSDPLRVRVLGMDGRFLSTFKLFLQGPCQNRAVTVSDESSEISLVDIDGRDGISLLAEEQARFPGRPILVTALRRPELPEIIYIPKPIKAPEMLAAIAEAKEKLSEPRAPAELFQKMDGHEKLRESPSPGREKKHTVHPHRRRSTHKTAMLLDEKAYSAYVGTVADINIKDPHHVAKAHYDKRKYLQGYVESAVTMAKSRRRILQLDCGWKPLIIFPHSNEIWIDADDKQIRSFCVVPIRSISDLDLRGNNEAPKSIISPVSADRINADHDPKKFQAIDSFIWKIALWTSNGRVPKGIQLDQPVHLDRWPNLSRFVNIPHSLRIAALLIDRPMPLIEAAAMLKIRQQYVFSFFSAAMAVGLAGQSDYRQDSIATSSARIEQPRTGLLQKILHRLKVG